MKAWVVRRNGAPEAMTFEDIADGPVADGMVRIAVAASGVNFFDSLLVAGTYQVRPELPFVPGAEVAGTVLEAPAGASVAPGDRVLAALHPAGLHHGGYAEITWARAGDVVKLPAAMPFEDAAAFFINYQTAWFGLHRRAALKAGEVVLVHAAAGGVGSAALQLASAAGATVIASVGGPDKAAVARRLGAQHVIDHRAQDVVQAVKEITGGRGADVVFDPVGGEAFDRATRCVAFEGRIVAVGFTSGQIPQARVNHVLVKNYSVVGLHWGLYTERRPDLVHECTATLLDLYAQGKIAPYVSRTAPLEHGAEALADVAAGRTTGKIVLTVASRG